MRERCTGSSTSPRVSQLNGHPALLQGASVGAAGHKPSFLGPSGKYIDLDKPRRGKAWQLISTCFIDVELPPHSPDTRVFVDTLGQPHRYTQACVHTALEPLHKLPVFLGWDYTQVQKVIPGLHPGLRSHALFPAAQPRGHRAPSTARPCTSITLLSQHR